MTPVAPSQSEWTQILEGIQDALARTLREAEERASAACPVSPSSEPEALARPEDFLASASGSKSEDSLAGASGSKVAGLDERVDRVRRPLDELDGAFAVDEAAARERVTALAGLRARLAEATGRAIG